MSARPDDPEIRRRLTEGGWKPGSELPPITRLGAYGVVRRAGRILLCRVGPGVLGEGRWTLPGGGLEFGEAPEAGAVREVEEETGLLTGIDGAPAIFSDTGVWPLAMGDVPFHHVRFVYPMVVLGGAERVEVGGSTDAFGWFAPAELATLARGDLVDRILARDGILPG
jgi:8-oxo-dGTP diphosphatase